MIVSQAKNAPTRGRETGREAVVRVSLTKKFGRRWRGSGGICHACNALGLGPLLCLCLCRGRTTSQTQRPRMPSDKRRRCRGRLPRPGNWRPSNHARTPAVIQDHTPSDWLSSGPKGDRGAGATQAPGPRSTVWCRSRSRFQIHTTYWTGDPSTHAT